ncbi:MAG: hypothetical protein A2284_05065 [Deltaproteobacteria bacterium RIFOXYA12_FULL_61_11]|nr:MAG: hypothetical protein A2284_05065 [Deltaproteobacteria bacterium RIFOXYA12_FULL_61_11]
MCAMVLSLLLIALTACKGTKGSSRRSATAQAKVQYPPKYTPEPAQNAWDDGDGDGLTTSEEQLCGTDPTKADTDGDGRSDHEECKLDSDGDGARDSQEEHVGTNPTLKDGNDQGIPDQELVDRVLQAEVPIVNPYAGQTQEQGPGFDPYADLDGDGLPAWREWECGTDQRRADSDGDGQNDATECGKDSDGDGVTDSLEEYLGLDPTKDRSAPGGMTDRAYADAVLAGGGGLEGAASPWRDGDGDGVPDYVERALGLDPAKDHSAPGGFSDRAYAVSVLGGVTSWPLDAEELGFDPWHDLDGDGLPYWREWECGTDPVRRDTDGDGEADNVECGKDGDGDGVPDSLEAFLGLDPTKDHSAPGGGTDRAYADEILTGRRAFELPYPASVLGGINPYSDEDGDGLPAWQEWGSGTDPRISDSDGDGKSDAIEAAADRDGDGLVDSLEEYLGLDPTQASSNPLGLPDAEFALDLLQGRVLLGSPFVGASSFGGSPYHDEDGDGLPNWREWYCGTDPRNKDSDGDGKDDRLECLSDQDGDGAPDSLEEFVGTDPTRDRSNPEGIPDREYAAARIWRAVPGGQASGAADPYADTDGDGLPSWREWECGTDPLHKDSDADGLDDASECAEDTDRDGVPDSLEERLGTDPTQDNSSGTELSDLEYAEQRLEGEYPFPGMGGTGAETPGTSSPPSIVAASDDPNADQDGDGLAAWEEHACGTSDYNNDSDSNGTSDLIDCREVHTGEPPAPGGEATPTTLVRRFTYAIGGTTSGSSTAGSPLGARNSANQAMCPAGEVLTGLRSCFHRYIERFDSLECARLEANGVVSGHHELELGYGGACDGTGILERIGDSLQGANQLNFSCNVGGRSSEFVTAFDAEVAGNDGANLQKLRLHCGRLSDDIAQTFPELFQDERDGVLMGDEGIGSLCERVGLNLGEDTLEDAQCPQNFVAVGIRANWDDDNSFGDWVLAGAGGAAVGALAGCGLAALVTLPLGGIGGLLCAGGVTLGAMGGACFLNSRLPTIHSFQLLCRRITVYTEVVAADEEALACLSTIGRTEVYDPSCHNLIGLEQDLAQR